MPARPRLESLDVFRGLTVAAMIVVNHPGDWTAVFPPLQHAAWNGCTFADLVFPCFLVIMGMAMPLAFARRRERHARTVVNRQILTRAGVLLGLGLLLNALAAWPALSTMRIPGVLQRIAITYAIAAPIVLHAPVAAEAGVALGLLVLQWGLLMFVPFEHHTPGLMIPTDNLAAHVDALIFGGHVLTRAGDPEGLIGIPTSVATALFGAIAGRWVQITPRPTRRLTGLALAGLLAAAAGLWWSAAWPFNKTLWTGSYALFATGLAVLAYVVVAYVVDGRSARRWMTPFVWLGVNPLTVYFGSELVGQLMDRPILVRANTPLGVKDVVFWRWLVPLLPWRGEWASLTFALGYAGIWVLVAGLLRRRQVIVRA